MSTILVVDDISFMRMRVKKLLIEYGYGVVEAEDGEQAVKTYLTIQPDAVIMDITMPCKNGLSALVEIRNIDSQAKVIMLSALGQQTIILQAMQAGAVDFLVKPYNAKKIIKTVEKTLA